MVFIHMSKKSDVTFFLGKITRHCRVHHVMGLPKYKSGGTFPYAHDFMYKS